MPGGTIGSLTTASSSATGDESTSLSFDIPPTALDQRSNLLAVEIHQVSGTSNDTSFDLALSGLVTR